MMSLGLFTGIPDLVALGLPLVILEIPFPNIDPVALQLGPVSIKWYGLSYLAGLVLGWLYIRSLAADATLWPNNIAPFLPEKTDDLLIYMTFGVILGGRLGYVLFYEPSNYVTNPLEILQVWKGGMAFHGALVGCGLAIWVFAKRHGINTLSVMDASSAAVPIGLLFGRLANFINGELWGRPTDVPWGMVFPDAAKFNESIGLPADAARHPSQLYEAFFEGLVLFLILRLVSHHFGALKRPGLVTGIFLIGYGFARSFCELFRQYDPYHALSTYGLTPGIAYSIPMVLLGAWFVYLARHPAVRTE